MRFSNPVANKLRADDRTLEALDKALYRAESALAPLLRENGVTVQDIEDAFLDHIYTHFQTEMDFVKTGKGGAANQPAIVRLHRKTKEVK